MPVIAGFDDPAAVRRAAGDLAYVVPPDDDRADSRAMSRPSKSSPPAGQIAGRIGYTEVPAHPPAAPSSGLDPVDSAPRPFGHDGLQSCRHFPPIGIPTDDSQIVTFRAFF